MFFDILIHCLRVWLNSLPSVLMSNKNLFQIFSMWVSKNRRLWCQFRICSRSRYFVTFFQCCVFWHQNQNVVKKLFLVHIGTVCQFWSLMCTKRPKKQKFSFSNENQNKLYFPILVSDQQSVKIISYIYIKNVCRHDDEWLDWRGTKYSLSLVSWWATDGSNFQLEWVGGGRGHKIKIKLNGTRISSVIIWRHFFLFSL